VLNAPLWDSTCRTSCGAIGALCEYAAVECCAATATCLDGQTEPTNDVPPCPKCCINGCCNPTETREVTCDDGLDNDCDGFTDCWDSDCFERVCGPGSICLETGCCGWDPCGGCECGYEYTPDCGGVSLTCGLGGCMVTQECVDCRCI